MKEQERDSLSVLLAEKPDSGGLIPGGGIACKLRLAKRGGVAMPVYLMDIYSKSERADLDAAGLKAIRSACKALMASHREDRS